MKLNTVLSFLAIAAVLALAGCAGGPAPAPSAILTSPQAQAVGSTAVTIAADVAATSVIQKNPQYAPDFAAGGALLTGMASGNPQLTPADVQLALSQSGQTNAAVATYAPMVALLINKYAAASGTNNLNGTVSQLVGDIGTGFTMAAGPAK